MKKIRIFAAGFSLLALLFIINSCKKEELPKNDAATKEFASMDHRLDDQDKKVETDGGVKGHETGLSEDEYNDLINTMINSSNTQFTQSWSDDRVGVVRMNGDCGGYPLLSIFMDAEDDNNNSDIGGWTGDNNLPYHGNVQLYFCVVEAMFFERLNYADFALLKLDNDLPFMISEAHVKIDNENDDNLNHVTLNGTKINTGDGGTGSLPGYSGNMYFDKDCYFDFYLFPQYAAGSPALPILNASIQQNYGVLGNQASPSGTRGYIQSDDEDDSDADACIINTFNDATYTYSGDVPSISGIPHVLELSTNHNSTWYFSRSF